MIGESLEILRIEYTSEFLVLEYIYNILFLYNWLSNYFFNR